MITIEIKFGLLENWVDSVSGYRHREGDKPAHISWWENGNKFKEEYVQKGFLSRENGKPCYIRWEPGGSVDEKR